MPLKPTTPFHCFLLLVLFSVCRCSANTSAPVDSISIDVSENELSSSDAKPTDEIHRNPDSDGDSAASPEFDPTPMVNVFLGTQGDRGQLSPAASYPFGMVKLGPDTALPGHSGYNYAFPALSGFSHTRIEGVGCSGAGGDIRVLPGIGDTVESSILIQKDSESAAPGYFRTVLGTYPDEIAAEMTVTKHAGLLRFDFPQSAVPQLFIQLNGP